MCKEISTHLTIWLHEHHHHHHSKFQHQNFDTFCYADISDPYLLFASKTSYNAVHYKNYVNIIPDECTPRQIWMLTRHGSRYAIKKKMEEFHKLTKLRHLIIHNHAQNRGYLCEKDIKNLREWSFKEPISKSDKLTSEGYNDLWEIGDRIRAKFPELFQTPENETMYKIQHTPHSKTKESAQAFVNGLFKKKIHIPVPTSDDLLTRIYPDCKVLPLPGADDPPDEGRNERTLFKEGPMVNEVVRNVSIRLGFVKSLTIGEIENIYDMCRYKKSWQFEKLSPWCACFLKSELQVLEYVADLAYYYNSGHGYSGNLRTGCPLVKDMMNRFSDIAKNEETSKEPNGVFYFGHSTTLYNLFARLGVAKDSEHITHKNYYNMTNRKWHTSLLAPFSANFAAVFLNCNGGIKHRVVFYHNETPFKLIGCHGYVCSWNILEQRYSNITDPSTCNFNFCNQQKQYIANEIKNNIDDKKYNNNTNATSTFEETEKNKSLKTTLIETDNKSVKSTLESHKKNNVNIIHAIPENTIENETGNVYIKTVHNKNIITSIHNTNDMNTGTFKSKTNWNNKEINILWLLISFTVFIIVFLFGYSLKRKQIKVIKTGYEKMNSLQLKDFHH